MAGHALCCAHLLRELTAVTETGTADDAIWARQATDALLELKKAAGAARGAGDEAIDAETLGKHGRWFRDAAAAGITLNAARRSPLQKKRHALAIRMASRADDYLRFATDLRLPFDNNEAEQVIRMSKLRIKVSGCMRSLHGAEAFCAIRSYLATASRHGIGWLDALTRAAEGNPWSPKPDKQAGHKAPPTLVPRGLISFEDGADGWKPLFGSIRSSQTTQVAYSGSHSLLITARSTYSAVGVETGLAGLRPGDMVTFHIYSDGQNAGSVLPFAERWNQPEDLTNKVQLPPHPGWFTLTWVVPSVSEVDAIGIQVVHHGSGQLTLAIDALTWPGS